jgi:DNA-binding MarR family transcriptional regulator
MFTINSPSAHTDTTLQNDVIAMQQTLMRLSWASQRLLARQLEAFHLTVPQLMALRALHRHTPEGCSMSVLAEAAHQVSATMTGIVDRLTEHGLVERRPDPGDRRALRVSLTQAGQAVLAEIDDLQQKRMLRILSGFSPQERREMLRLMDRYLETTLAEIEA